MLRWKRIRLTVRVGCDSCAEIFRCYSENSFPSLPEAKKDSQIADGQIDMAFVLLGLMV